MNKKCLTAIMLTIFLLLMTLSAYLTTFIPITNKWIGLIAGGIIFFVTSVFGVIFHKKLKMAIISFFLNPISCGIAIDSLFVYSGTPKVIHTLVLIGVILIWLIAYCFISNIEFVQRFYIPCMIIWVAILLSGGIAFAVITKNVLSYLTIIYTVPSVFFFIGLAIKAHDPAEQFKNNAFLSSIIVIIVLLIILVIVSEGEVADFTLDIGSGKKRKNKTNPYIYL